MHICVYVALQTCMIRVRMLYPMYVLLPLEDEGFIPCLRPWLYANFSSNP